MTERIYRNIEGDFVAMDDRGLFRGRAEGDSVLADLLRFARVGDDPVSVPGRFVRWLGRVCPEMVQAAPDSRLLALPAPTILDLYSLLADIDASGYEILVTNGTSEPKFSALDAVVPEEVAFTRHSSILCRARLADGGRSVLVSCSSMGGIVEAIVDMHSTAGWDLFTEHLSGARHIGEPTFVRHPPAPERLPKLPRRQRTLWLERQLELICGFEVGVIERRHTMRDAGVVPSSSTARFAQAMARLYGVTGAREAVFVLDQSVPVAGGHFERHLAVLIEEWQLREPLGMRLSTEAVMEQLGKRVREPVLREDVLAREYWGEGA